MRAHDHLITCFLPAGNALAVLERLRDELGHHSMAYHHARGVGTGTRTGRRRVVAAERDVITVLAPADRADALFRFLYYACGLDQPNSGMIYMEKVLRSAGTVPPPASPGR